MKYLALVVLVAACQAQFVSFPSNGGSPSGAAGGSLAGSYPNPGIAGLSNAHAVACTLSASVLGECTSAATIPGFTSTGQIFLPDGTTVHPALSFTDATGIGFSFLNTNAAKFSAGGADLLRFDANFGLGLLNGTWLQFYTGTGSPNASISNPSAGVTQFGTTTNNALGSWIALNGTLGGSLQGTSAQPTVNATSCTGATIGTGATNLSGTITGLPTSSCTVILTFAGSATATHGWSCGISDQTTGNIFRQSGSTTTTVSFTGTSVSGDVLSYGPCGGF